MDAAQPAVVEKPVVALPKPRNDRGDADEVLDRANDAYREGLTVEFVEVEE